MDETKCISGREVAGSNTVSTPYLKGGLFSRYAAGCDKWELL